MVGSKLSGPLPNPSTGQFASLRFLDMANNTFSGSIPEGWNKTGIFQLVSSCLGSGRGASPSSAHACCALLLPVLVVR